MDDGFLSITDRYTPLYDRRIETVLFMGMTPLMDDSVGAPTLVH